MFIINLIGGIAIMACITICILLLVSIYKDKKLHNEEPVKRAVKQRKHIYGTSREVVSVYENGDEFHLRKK